MLMEPAPPWERQPYDTDKSWIAFSLHYLPITGQRTVVEAFRSFKGHKFKSATRADKTFYRWSRGLDSRGVKIGATWEERATAWDTHLKQESIKKHINKLERVYDQMGDTAEKLVSKLKTAVANWDPLVMSKTSDPAKFTRPIVDLLAILEALNGGVGKSDIESEMAADNKGAGVTPMERIDALAEILSKNKRQDKPGESSS